MTAQRSSSLFAAMAGPDPALASQADGIKNVAGTIAFANAGPGTARSDFFIMVSDFPSLDATATNPGFAAFGHVVEGMDVVKAILTAPVSPTLGAGAMKGQMLEPAVRITKAERIKPLRQAQDRP